MRQFMAATFTDLIVRVVLAFVLSGTALASTGIWCAWPIGWTVATVISILFYRKGRVEYRAGGGPRGAGSGECFRVTAISEKNLQGI